MKHILYTLAFVFASQYIFAQADTIRKVKASSDSFYVLQNVLVSGAINSKTLKQQPMSVSVIEAKPFYNTSISGLDLLKQVPGIKVRQDGGFGSRSNVFINGSTGKQVKTFIDGLPQDNLGESQSLNTFPVEQMERIEVYKGVLPVELGADALGAAVNIITRKEQNDYADASYSIGSFNTHKLNLSAKKFFNRYFFSSVQMNANYAENDYTIDGEVPNATGNIEVKQVRRFHDVYKNYNIKAQVGFQNAPFAGHLNLTLIKTGLYDEIQNNLVATQPYGKAIYKESLLSAILKYQKSNLFKNFNISTVFSYNRIHGFFRDTSKNVYNWEGHVVNRKLTGAEIVSSGNLLHLYTAISSARLIASYYLKSNIKLVLANTFQNYYRKGKDTLAQQYYGGIDYFGKPSSLSKNITGIAMEGNSFQSKLKFSTGVKYYYAQLTAQEINWNTQTTTSKTLQAFAYNAALSYKVHENVLLKTSYEHAARLPEAEEALGDLMLIKPNPTINAERSENLNLSVLGTVRKTEIELTGFYRDVSNIIYLRTSQFSSQYQNLLSVRVLGIEGSASSSFGKHFSFNGNITFQDLRNRSSIDNSGINNDHYKNARMPNIPYLFANGGIGYIKENLLGKNTSFQLWWNTSYTHEYFLYWEVDGARELKNRIPTQWLQYAGISCHLPNKRLSVAVEVNNVTNEKAYDNFKVQLPGRWFSCKVRFYYSKFKQDKK